MDFARPFPRSTRTQTIKVAAGFTGLKAKPVGEKSKSSSPRKAVIDFNVEVLQTDARGVEIRVVRGHDSCLATCSVCAIAYCE